MRDRRRTSPALRMARLPYDLLHAHEIHDGVHRLSRGTGNGELPEIETNVDAAPGPGEHQGHLALGEGLRVARFDHARVHLPLGVGAEQLGDAAVQERRVCEMGFGSDLSGAFPERDCAGQARGLLFRRAVMGDRVLFEP